MMQLKFKKLFGNAKCPTCATNGSVGLDIYAIQSYMLYARSRELVGTGIAVEIPEGHYGMVVGRSGNTIKKGLVVATGIIDSDYRGEIGVMAFNESGRNIYIEAGDRIGQLIIAPYPHIELAEVAELSETDRGNKGFGSTGRK